MKDFLDFLPQETYKGTGGIMTNDYAAMTPEERAAEQARLVAAYDSSRPVDTKTYRMVFPEGEDFFTPVTEQKGHPTFVEWEK